MIRSKNKIKFTKIWLIPLIILVTQSYYSSFAQSNRPKDNRTFNEKFQDGLDSLDNTEKVQKVESMTFNEMEQRNNQNTFSRSNYQNSNETSGIEIILIIGLGALLLGAFSSLKRASFINFLAKMSYRFSAQYNKDQFKLKVVELKKLLDSGVISQKVYDSRMEEILKDIKL
jgi:hypothetical protein